MQSGAVVVRERGLAVLFQFEAVAILVVDDGHGKLTAQLAAGCGARRPRIRSATKNGA